MHNPLPTLLRVEQAATRLSLTRQEVMDLIRTGKLSAQRIGAYNYRVAETHLGNWLAPYSGSKDCTDCNVKISRQTFYYPFIGIATHDRSSVQPAAGNQS
jgi:excisionase family DNA binding protein